MKADELRKRFLAFFESKGHEVVPSDTLVPKDDPTLLFTSAGMNQFKDRFIGRNVTYRRAASCQKCLRTADLERVGKTAYHHTFFEMLGNFSFGDYFKEEAIAWAWEFMVDVLKLPEEKLWVSVYEDDDEACHIWKEKIKVPARKIVKLGDEENFWPSNAKKDGPNGPCGPCSEIFYDWGKGVGCGKDDCTPECDCGRFVEVWNLVFTQFNRTGAGKLEPLASKNIDTGMGLERLTAVMQGVYTNFETDIFKPIIDPINALLKKEVRDAVHDKRSTINAIADHIRAVSFAILDGVMPSNEGRGYVIRKLIRTAFLHGRSLGLKEPFLYKLTFGVARSMGGPYSEMERRHQDIAGVIKAEEEFFTQNLDMDRARALYEERFGKSPSSTDEKIVASSARAACFLNDTHGIPPELTKEIAAESGHVRDDKLWQQVYEASVEELREISRKKSGFYAEGIFAETAASKIAGSVEKTEFLGYRTTRARARVVKLFTGSEETKEARPPANISVILDRTPFYAEAGGQVGDSGTLEKKGLSVKISDTKRIGDIFVHLGQLVEGSIKAGDEIEAQVDSKRRQAIARNHTATHLLQGALRKVLGEHVHQSGSVVDENRLRFDFTHPKKLSARELERIEDMVNQNIQASEAVSVEDEAELKKAVEEGALALFGEKYGRKVRVVSVGEYSKELCGGTHVTETSEIRLFKITSEGSVAAGLRRIEAVTDAAVDEYAVEEEKAIIERLKDRASSVDKILPGLEEKDDAKGRAGDLILKVGKINPALKPPLSYKEYLKWDRSKRLKLLEAIGTLEGLKVKMEKRIAASKLKKTRSGVDDIIKQARRVGDSFIIAEEIEEADPKILRSLSDEIKSKIKSGIIVLSAQKEGRISFVCSVTQDLIKQGLRAGDIAKHMAAITSGGGGGREDFAMAGGKDPSKLREALEYVHNTVTKELEK